METQLHPGPHACSRMEQLYTEDAYMTQKVLLIDGCFFVLSATLNSQLCGPDAVPRAVVAGHCLCLKRSPGWH